MKRLITVAAIMAAGWASAQLVGTISVDVRGTATAAETVTGGQSNLIATAWQNPAAATNWTWTSDGAEITLTGYSGPNDVVIPDMLDGLPVTAIGNYCFWSTPPTFFSAITSVSGGANVTSIGVSAFYWCLNLASVNLPAATSIGHSVFHSCTSLTSVNLPAVTSIGHSVFHSCTSLTSVTFGQNAPNEQINFYLNTPNVTNYVTNPTATGWGETFCDRPVVRMPAYAASFHGDGTPLTGVTKPGDLAAYVQTTAIPGPGCTDIGTATEITGATVAYRTAPTAAYTLAVTNTAPRYTYSLRVESTNAYTLASGLYEDDAITPTGTNVFVFVPDTGTVWRIYGRAR